MGIPLSPPAIAGLNAASADQCDKVVQHTTVAGIHLAPVGRRTALDSSGAFEATSRWRGPADPAFGLRRAALASVGFS